MMVSRRTAYVVLFGVAVLAVVGGIYTPRLMNWAGYGDVSVDEAWNIIQDKPELVILDVRTQEEYDEGHIENAVLIPVQELPDRWGELNTNDELLVYCRTGNRSTTAVEILEEAGFGKIYHMHQGISVWISEGFPVVQ